MPYCDRCGWPAPHPARARRSRRRSRHLTSQNQPAPQSAPYQPKPAGTAAAEAVVAPRATVAIWSDLAWSSHLYGVRTGLVWSTDRHWRSGWVSGTQLLPYSYFVRYLFGQSASYPAIKKVPNEVGPSELAFRKWPPDIAEYSKSIVLLNLCASPMNDRCLPSPNSMLAIH